MIVKVSELEGRALDWAVASVLYGAPSREFKRNDKVITWAFHRDIYGRDNWFISAEDCCLGKNEKVFEPSCNWAHTGILIDEFSLTIKDLRRYAEGKFLVSCEYTGDDDDYTVVAQPNRDAKIAICHAVCMTENGNDEIEIPDELVEV